MLRGGTNHLRIERGRWEGKKVEERTCMVCVCNSVEDEQHFLLECPMYACERERMFVEIRQRCNIEIENREKEERMNLLIGEKGLGERGEEVRKIVMIYISKAFRIRSRYV